MIPETDPTPSAAQRAEGARTVVLRNTLFLLVAQVLAVPLSIVVNAVMARHLGAEDFGYLYLAATLVSAGFLVVDWGQSGTLPQRIAQQRDRAGVFLGSGMAWRAVAAVGVYVVLAAACLVLGYDTNFQIMLVLTTLGAAVASFMTACCDAVRGFERTDITAYASVGGQLVGLAFVVPTLLLGGQVRAVLAVQAASNVIMLAYVWRSLRPVGVGKLSFEKSTAKLLLKEGFPFMFVGVAIALHSNVDAVFLSKLAPPEVIGWHAVARKLVGVLVYPVMALITSLYPTLCRLFVEDMEAFRRTARSAIRSTCALAVPIALSCALFPEVGISIFGRHGYGAAEDNLRVMALNLGLTYFSMTLGSCLLAAGKQRTWAIFQFLSVGVSLVLDPLLIPWFQARVGNGGLGVCWAGVACEVLMLVGGIALTPKGVFDTTLIRSLFLALASGAAMALVARLLGSVTAFVTAPIALVVYAAVMWFTGGVDRWQVIRIINAVKQKVSR